MFVLFLTFSPTRRATLKFFHSVYTRKFIPWILGRTVLFWFWKIWSVDFAMHWLHFRMILKWVVPWHYLTKFPVEDEGLIQQTQILRHWLFLFALFLFSLWKCITFRNSVIMACAESHSVLTVNPAHCIYNIIWRCGICVAVLMLRLTTFKPLIHSCESIM